MSPKYIANNNNGTPKINNFQPNNTIIFIGLVNKFAITDLNISVILPLMIVQIISDTLVNNKFITSNYRLLFD